MKKLKELYERGVNKAKEIGGAVKKKVKEVKDEAVEFCVQNPGVIMPLMAGVGMLITGASTMATRAARASTIKDENWTGGNFRTVHPLSNTELLELEQRLKNGEEKGEALSNMGVLKKEKRRKS